MKKDKYSKKLKSYGKEDDDFIRPKRQSLKKKLEQRNRQDLYNDMDEDFEDFDEMDETDDYYKDDDYNNYFGDEEDEY